MEEETKNEKGMKVIVTMDGSQQAERAFNFYMSTVHERRNEVILLHCVNPSPQAIIGTFTPVNPQIIAEAIKTEDKKGKTICKNMEKLLEDMGRGGKVSVMRIEGDPGPAIVEKADECGASLIVVGSRGFGTVRRTILGSVSDYILHHANVPVLICR